jgi:hypothetical protein
MSSFSPTEAALEGVRLSRERPRAILLWTGYYFAFTILLSLVSYFTLGANAKESLAALQRPTGDAEEFSKLIQQSWPFVAVALPLGLVFQAMFTAAVYRIILGSPEDTHTWLRLGADELRLLVLKVVMTAIWTVLLFIGLFTVQTAGVGASQVATLLGMVVDMGLIWIGVLIWVRLSLAGPATFVEHRVMIFQSWPLTHGQFWRLLGTYLMSFAIAAVVFLLMLVVFGAILELVARFTGISLNDVSLSAASVPVFVMAVASQAIISLVFTCYYVTVMSPAAQAYHDLIGKR